MDNMTFVTTDRRLVSFYSNRRQVIRQFTFAHFLLSLDPVEPVKPSFKKQEHTQLKSLNIMGRK